MSGLWPLVWRAVGARPLRSGLTILAVALGIAVVLGAQIVVNGLDAQAAAAAQLRAGASGLDVRLDAGDGLTAAQVAALGTLPGVTQAVPLYEKRVAAAPAGASLTGLTVTLVGLQDGSAALRPVEVVAGRLPRPGSSSEVAIDAGLLPALGMPSSGTAAVGRRVQLVTATGPDTFTVVGTTADTSAGPVFTRSAVFADDAAMLSAFRLGLRTQMVALRLDPGTAARIVASEVHAQLGDTVTTVDPSGGGDEPLSDLRPLLALLTVLSLMVGAGVTANSVALAVIERRREIGLLRAAGASSAQVFRMFIAEASLLAAVAVPLGLGVGVALGAVLDGAYAPADLPGPVFSVAVWQILAAAAAGAGAGIAGGLAPALMAARMPVLASLRVRPETRRRRAAPFLVAGAVAALVAGAVCFAATSAGVVALGVALFLLGVVLAVPVVSPVAIRLLSRGLAPVAPAAANSAAGLMRSRQRTTLTAAGLAVSVAVAVAVSSLTAGALSASDSWVSGLFTGNELIISPVTQRDGVATAIAESPGVAALTPLRTFSATVQGSVTGITAIDPAAYESTGTLQVVGAPRLQALQALENGPSFLAPAQLAATYGWQVGTQVPVQAASGTVFFTMTGMVVHSFPAGDGSESLLMADDMARTYFGSVAAGFDDLVVTTDGSTAAVAATAATYGMEGVTVDDVGAAARDALQRSIGLLLALAIVTVGIAMVAVINTLLVNVRQGTRELALLRAVGLSRRQALRLVLGECGVLAIAATVGGVAAGCVVALPMLRASASMGFAPHFAFPVVTAAVLLVTLAAAVLLAAYGPARRATSASVLDALRNE